MKLRRFWCKLGFLVSILIMTRLKVPFIVLSNQSFYVLSICFRIQYQYSFIFVERNYHLMIWFKINRYSSFKNWFSRFTTTWRKNQNTRVLDLDQMMKILLQTHVNTRKVIKTHRKRNHLSRFCSISFLKSNESLRLNIKYKI